MIEFDKKTIVIILSVCSIIILLLIISSMVVLGYGLWKRIWFFRDDEIVIQPLPTPTPSPTPYPYPNPNPSIPYPIPDQFPLPVPGQQIVLDFGIDNINVVNPVRDNSTPGNTVTNTNNPNTCTFDYNLRYRATNIQSSLVTDFTGRYLLSPNGPFRSITMRSPDMRPGYSNAIIEIDGVSKCLKLDLSKANVVTVMNAYNGLPFTYLSSVGGIKKGYFDGRIYDLVR